MCIRDRPSFTSPKIFLGILLSETLKLCTSLLNSVQVSAEYVTTSLVKVSYNPSMVLLPIKLDLKIV